MSIALRKYQKSTFIVTRDRGRIVKVKKDAEFADDIILVTSTLQREIS